MTRRILPSRSGVTLTEILISIMIMGVGLVSLATLFPLGLARIREAQRFTRSAFLSETANDDAMARALLNKLSFLNSWYTVYTGGGAVGFDPFSYDPPGGMPQTLQQGTVLPPANGVGIYPGNVMVGPGLPIAYDPLWWATVHQFTSMPGNGPVVSPWTTEARFGYGLPSVRPDPNGGGNSLPSAHGLQRITNFIPFTPSNAGTALMAGPVQLFWPFYYPNLINNGGSLQPLGPDLAGDIFTSRDDVVMQREQGNAVNVQPTVSAAFSGIRVLVNATGLGSPVVPDMSLGQVTNDWSYSWMFTGKQTDVSDLSIFDGQIVIFQNRPFGVESATYALSNNTPQQFPMGERVVEAIYGAGNRKSITLRWPQGDPEPEVRVGGWLCDCTYERLAANQVARALLPQNAQRCYWYQITKKSPVTVATPCTGDPGVYNQMVVGVSAQLQAFTPTIPTGTNPYDPFHVNVALINPYVVNVFPAQLYMR